jgi:hypothetical protein
VLPNDKYLISADTDYNLDDFPPDVANFMKRITINKDKEDRKRLKHRVDSTFDREINKVLHL